MGTDLAGEDGALERLLESFLESSEPPAADSSQRQDTYAEKSPDPRNPPGLRVRPSELVFWSGRTGLFNNDILIVTTQGG
jgi:hypothetical protein